MLDRHKKEIQRWLNNSSEPKVWVIAIFKKNWQLRKFSTCYWEDYCYYIIDDEQAELRKLQIDERRAEFEYYSVLKHGWVYTEKPLWNKYGQYRVKPIFKVRDKIKYRDCNEVCTIKSILDDRYMLDNKEYILFTNQFEYELLKDEFEYPIFKATSKGTDKEYIVKFTDLTTGEVVFAMPDAPYLVGVKANDWTAHTNNDKWQDVLYDKEKDLYDKQPILCWNNNYKTTKHIKFYDALNKCIFDYNGKGNGCRYDNYIPYPHPEDNFIIEMYKNLKD